MVCQVMSFLGKTIFCANGNAQFCQLCCDIQSNILNVYYSPIHLSFSPVSAPEAVPVVKVSSFFVISSSWCEYCYQYNAPSLCLLFSRFWDSYLKLWQWYGTMCKMHISLQELQAVALMPCKMAFRLSSNVVALHLDNCTVKAYLCNQGGTSSLFLSRLAYHIFNLADKQGITLEPASLHCSVCISSLGSNWSGFFGILMYQLMSVLLHLGKSLTSGFLGVEYIQPPLDILGEVCVSFSTFSFPSSIKLPGRMCHRSVQTSFVAMLDGGSLASQHVGRCSSVVSLCKGPCHGYLFRPCVQGSTITALNPLAAQRCVLFRQVLSSQCQAVVGVTQASITNVYQQYWKDQARWCAWRVTKQCHFCP